MYMNIDELVFKQEQESKKVGKLLLTGFHKDDGYFRTNASAGGINSDFINADSYVKGLDKKIDGSYSGKVVPLKPTKNLLFKDREIGGGDTRNKKSSNSIFNQDTSRKNYSLNILDSDIQNHVQYKTGVDSRRRD